MDANTLRIFSFTGGGSKGYVSNKFMQRFGGLLNPNSFDISKWADVLCGTSIGSILACGYPYGKTPADLETFFKAKAKRIFTIRTISEYIKSQIVSSWWDSSSWLSSLGSNTASEDSNRPSAIQKVALILANDQFYKSPDDNADYGHNILQQTLEANFGADTLADLKTYVVIPSFIKNKSRFVLFSNYNDSRFIGQTAKIVDVCRASSAAPVYLPPYTINGDDYIDGGLYANDAVLAAVQLGLAVKPTAKRIVIVGVGTGTGNMGFDGNESLTGSSLMVEELVKLMNVAMTGAEEWSDYFLSGLSKITMLPVYYYKFQPKFDDYKDLIKDNFPNGFPNEMDNSTTAWFDALDTIVDAHYTAESDLISNIYGHLTA